MQRLAADSTGSASLLPVVEYQIRVGLSTNDGRILRPSLVADYVASKLPDFNAVKGIGYWNRAREPMVLVSVFDLTRRGFHFFHSLAETLASQLDQDSVLLSWVVHEAALLVKRRVNSPILPTSLQTISEVSI